MTKPTIGAMRRRMALETPSLIPDGVGGFTTVWKTSAILWAELTPLSGKEAERADGRAGNNRSRIIIRAGQVIAPSQRFRFGERIFAILSVLALQGRNTHLVCECEEVDL